MRRSSAILGLLLALASMPARAATDDAKAGGPAGQNSAPPAKESSPQPWVRQVYAIVLRSMAPLSKTLPRGDYRVHFSIDEEGRGSRYGVKGNVGAAQAAVIVAALAARSFPVPPDRASHAMSFTVKVK